MWYVEWYILYLFANLYAVTTSKCVLCVVFIRVGVIPVCCVVVDTVARLKAWHKHAAFWYKILFIGLPWRVKIVSERTVLPRIKGCWSIGNAKQSYLNPTRRNFWISSSKLMCLQDFYLFFWRVVQFKKQTSENLSFLYIFFSPPEPLSYAYCDSLFVFGGNFSFVTSLMLATFTNFPD